MWKRLYSGRPIATSSAVSPAHRQACKGLLAAGLFSAKPKQRDADLALQRDARVCRERYAGAGP